MLNCQAWIYNIFKAISQLFHCGPAWSFRLADVTEVTLAGKTTPSGPGSSARYKFQINGIGQTVPPGAELVPGHSGWERVGASSVGEDAINAMLKRAHDYLGQPTPSLLSSWQLAVSDNMTEQMLGSASPSTSFSAHSKLSDAHARRTRCISDTMLKKRVFGRLVTVLLKNMQNPSRSRKVVSGNSQGSESELSPVSSGIWLLAENSQHVSLFPSTVQHDYLSYREVPSLIHDFEVETPCLQEPPACSFTDTGRYQLPAKSRSLRIGYCSGSRGILNRNSVFVKAIIHLVLAVILVIGPGVAVITLHSFSDPSNAGHVAANIPALSSSLITLNSFIMHLLRVLVAKPNERSLPYLKGLSISALVITTALNVFFSALLFVHHPEDDLYLNLTKLTCIFYAILVEVLVFGGGTFLLFRCRLQVVWCLPAIMLWLQLALCVNVRAQLHPRRAKERTLVLASIVFYAGGTMASTCLGLVGVVLCWETLFIVEFMFLGGMSLWIIALPLLKHVVLEAMASEVESSSVDAEIDYGSGSRSKTPCNTDSTRKEHLEDGTSMDHGNSAILTAEKGQLCGRRKLPDQEAFNAYAQDGQHHVHLLPVQTCSPEGLDHMTGSSSTIETLSTTYGNEHLRGGSSANRWSIASQCSSSENSLAESRPPTPPNARASSVLDPRMEQDIADVEKEYAP
ncbi:hypothetical protein B0H21DRAFT_708400 [Amylocystis lapponica]|nr:hypothetical protein B0H21DRAFT_708400 [Amylocystis lapponica]